MNSKIEEMRSWQRHLKSNVISDNVKKMNVINNISAQRHQNYFSSLFPWGVMDNFMLWRPSWTPSWISSLLPVIYTTLSTQVFLFTVLGAYYQDQESKWGDIWCTQDPLTPGLSVITLVMNFCPTENRTACMHQTYKSIRIIFTQLSLLYMVS